MARQSLRWLIGLVVALQANVAFGQPVQSREPTSTHIFPAGGKRGTVVKAHLGGECWPPGMNLSILGEGVSAPGVVGPEVKSRFEPSLRRVPRDADDVTARVTYPRKFETTLSIAADSEPGVRFWRVWGGWGGTRLRPFFVGDLPEFIESESNSQFETAERISLPMVVNGQIAGERDQDYFAFAANAGEVVTCDVMAAHIGSPLQPVIALFDNQRRNLSGDELRVGNDPVVSYRIPATGEYRLHVANLGYGGGPAYVYRVTVTTAPYAPLPFPPPGKEDIPSVAAEGDNHSAESARELTAPAAVNARFMKSNEDDWYRIRAKKDDAFTIACRAFPHDSAAVPQLTLFDAKGTPQVKAGNIESPERGFVVDWKAPADGVYLVRLRDLQYGSRAGPEFAYRLTLESSRPDFSLRLDADYLNVVQAGKTDVDLLVERTGGFAGPIDLIAEGGAEGVKVEPARIAEKQSRLKLTFSATNDTRPTDTAVRFLGKAMAAGQTIERKAVVSSLGRDGDELHLTVQHKPVFRLSCNEAYQYAPRGSIHPYKMKIERLDGFDGPIVLQLCDRQVQDLDGVDILETVIPTDAKEALNLVYLPETMHTDVQHHSRPYAQAYATFTDKWGQKQSLLAVSTHRCMIRTLPPVAKLRATTPEITARLGDVFDCKFALERVAPFNEPAEIVLMDRPGFTAERIHVEGDQQDVIIRIHIAADALRLDGQALTFRAHGKLASGGTVITEATIPVVFGVGASAASEDKQRRPTEK